MDSNQYIKITRVPYEEPYHVNLLFKASNGESIGSLEFYENADIFHESGKALIEFPKDLDDEFIWELGSENPEDNFAYYFKMRVFLLDDCGHSCIQIRINNNENFPDRTISEFCITCEPAGLSRLGYLFSRFSRFNDTVLFWDSIDGELS